jgi:multidrug efflux system membrane fusion protein
MRQWSFSSISAQPRTWVVAGLVGATVATVFALVFTSKYTPDAQANVASAAAAAVPVTVGLLKPRSVNPFVEFSGRIDAVDFAEIRPQVSGRITEIRFQDGQHVNAGDVLFVIDPRPYRAAVDKAQADLATATHNAKFAKAERDRGSELVKSNTLSQETYDQRVNADDSGQSAVQSAQAVLAAAQVNLDYAYVKAPISGRISRAEITLGNLVGSPTTPPQLLASIVSDNGVYADFEVDEQTYLDNVRNYGQGQQDEEKIPVELVVRGDSGHVYRGHIQSFDNRIDTGTGTIRARAGFDNKDGSLIPGMFVSVRMGDGTLDDALLVPESAIGSDQSKRFVFVVSEGNKAEYRTVQLGPQVDGSRVVLTGVKAGDRVILDHLQRLAPGVPVDLQQDRRSAIN